MGHFSAPWGNEIRIGVLEALTALVFCVVMFLSIQGGMITLLRDVQESKQNLYFIMVDLLLSSLLALVYTNDLFTAYVFIEINTIAACGLIMIRDNGHCLVAATKYMIMSLIGSGLVLISICLLYDLTGHLLMSNIQETIASGMVQAEYAFPLTIVVGLLCVGLAIKSALYPFSSWLPDAYGYSTTTSSALLSSLVSKGYIFLLIKIIYRVIGFDVLYQTGVGNIFFVFGIAGMMIGSLKAMKQTDIRRLVAYSSIAQIGYIYMGLGMGITAGVVAAVFHIFSHAATKSLLFVSANGLSEVSGKSKDFDDLKGSGYRNKVAGVTFLIGAFSMIGIPLLSGFISKVSFASAAMQIGDKKLYLAMLALAFSSILNAVYFIKAISVIFDVKHVGTKKEERKQSPLFVFACIAFCILNFALGMGAQPILDAIATGLSLFA
jgi:multicomponent Na+:H+ antiporter subunit D